MKEHTDPGLRGGVLVMTRAHAVRAMPDMCVGAVVSQTRVAVATHEDRIRAVLAVLSGKASPTQEALRCGVSESDVEQWRRQFVDSGRLALSLPGRQLHPPTAGLDEENAALKAELRAKVAEYRLYRQAAQGKLGTFAHVEEIRRESGIAIARFCVLIGISTRTYFRRLESLRNVQPPKEVNGCTSITTICAELVKDYVADHPGYGYRRIRELMIADGHMVSASTVFRAMRISRRRTSGPAARESP